MENQTVKSSGTYLGGAYLICVVLFFTSFIGITYGFGIYLFPAIATEMIGDLRFTYGQMGVTTGLAQVGFIVFALISGVLTSVFGALRMIKVAIALFVSVLLLLIIADNFLLVSICLILMAGVAASLWTLMIGVCKEYIDVKYRARALGLISSGTAYGVFVNSLLIAYLLPGYGWRSLWIATFSISAVICVGAFILLARLEKRDNKKSPPESIPDEDSPDEDSPDEDRLWMRIKTFPIATATPVLIITFLSGLACLPFQTYLSSFLVDERGIGIEETAIAWRLIGITGMVSGFAMGWLADRITVRWALVMLCPVLLLSTILLLYFDGGRFDLYVISVLFGVAFYSIFGLVPAYISIVFNAGVVPLVAALANVSLGLGAAFGNALGGWLREEYGSFQWIYIVILVAAVVSIAISVLMNGETKGVTR